MEYPGYTEPVPQPLSKADRTETSYLVEAAPRIDVISTQNIAIEHIVDSLVALQLTLKKVGFWRKANTRAPFWRYREMLEDAGRLRYQADMLEKRVRTLYRKWEKEEEAKRSR